MQPMTAIEQRTASIADTVFARVVDLGSARHPYLTALLRASGTASFRNLADAVHLLCNLYGRYPGLVDIALTGAPAGPAREWLVEASDQFERERLYLVRLAAAIGPLPGTPGGAQTESAIQAQRRAVETLARSERFGCALGAATALICDWVSIRPLLDRAAARTGIDCPLSALPGESVLARAIDSSVDGLAAERALAFGGEQLLLQHRALFDLLEARAAARTD